MCMECDFEGTAIANDPTFDILFCPSCGEPLTYDEEDDYEDPISESER